MRERLHEIIQPAEEDDFPSKLYDIFIVVTAIISITPMLVRYNVASPTFFSAISLIDTVTVLILLFDYEMRWITFDIRCAENGFHDAKGKPWGWRAFFMYPFTLPAIIDLAAILPTLIVLPEACYYLILLRLFKALRVMKSIKIVKNVLIREGKTLLSVLAITVLYVFVVAIILYVVEPNTFSSFINAFYWSTTSLATIGYGDISPQTQLGKVINIISAVIGLAIVALPAGIITGGFVFEIRHQKEIGEQRKKKRNARFNLNEKISDTVEAVTDVVKEQKISSYFKNNPKVCRYLVVIVGCICLEFVLYFLSLQLANHIGISLIDYVGASIAAFILEPAAGIIVGFFSTLLMAFTYQEPGKTLYVAIYVLFALLFGRFIRFDKKIPITKQIMIILTGVFIIILCNIIIAIAIQDTAEVNGKILCAVSADGSINVDALLIISGLYSVLLLVYIMENYFIVYLIHRFQVRKKKTYQLNAVHESTYEHFESDHDEDENSSTECAAKTAEPKKREPETKEGTKQ